MSYPLHIIGGSLYGLLLALSLRSLSNDLEIHIHEKSDQFLSSWNNLCNESPESIAPITKPSATNPPKVTNSNTFASNAGFDACNKYLICKSKFKDIDNAKLSVAHGNGGVLSSQVTNIWGVSETI